MCTALSQVPWDDSPPGHVFQLGEGNVVEVAAQFVASANLGRAVEDGAGTCGISFRAEPDHLCRLFKSTRLNLLIILALERALIPINEPFHTSTLST